MQFAIEKLVKVIKQHYIDNNSRITYAEVPPEPDPCLIIVHSVQDIQDEGKTETVKFSDRWAFLSKQWRLLA